MHLAGKKVGIWGFGKVGQSVADYAHKRGASLLICDVKNPEPALLKHYNALYISQDELSIFWQQSDYIIPSPGIDIRPVYNEIASKLITELDLFAHEWKNPVYAVTGSVGKTTITTLLAEILKRIHPTLAGGNIGYAALNVLTKATPLAHALLEVSSFQLEFTELFAPDLGIITNLHSNHLDRHDTMEKYRAAKLRLIAHQRLDQQILIPSSLWVEAQKVRSFDVKKVALFSQEKPSCCLQNITYYWLENSMVFKNGLPLFNPYPLTPFTFAENILIICAALDMLGHNLNELDLTFASTIIPAHRMEPVKNKSGITIYNDSKSTTIASTQAALARVGTTPTHLLLGGLSKGADRSVLIKELPQSILHVYCFGKEAAQLAQWCAQSGKKYSIHDTLESAVTHSIQAAKRGDVILFSPAGSSFDLFKNFEERGDIFKELVSRTVNSHP